MSWESTVRARFSDANDWEVSDGDLPIMERLCESTQIMGHPQIIRQGNRRLFVAISLDLYGALMQVYGTAPEGSRWWPFADEVMVEKLTPVGGHDQYRVTEDKTVLAAYVTVCDAPVVAGTVRAYYCWMCRSDGCHHCSLVREKEEIAPMAPQWHRKKKNLI